MLIDTVDLLWTAIRVAATGALCKGALRVLSFLTRCRARSAKLPALGGIGPLAYVSCSLAEFLWRKAAWHWLEPWAPPSTTVDLSECEGCE